MAIHVASLHDFARSGRFEPGPPPPGVGGVQTRPQILSGEVLRLAPCMAYRCCRRCAQQPFRVSAPTRHRPFSNQAIFEPGDHLHAPGEWAVAG